jgi:hypothetical protein
MDDTDSNLADSIRRDAQRMRLLLRGLPPSRVIITEIWGRDITQRRAYAAVNGMPLEPNDSVLVYYSGHGAMIGLNHFFTLGNGQRINRGLLALEIENRKPRFAFLLSDCCAVIASRGRSPADEELTARHNPHLERLLLGHEGRVNWSSSSPGEITMADMFTPSLVAAAYSSRTWDEWYRKTYGLSNNLYQQWRRENPSDEVARRQPMQRAWWISPANWVRPR